MNAQAGRASLPREKVEAPAISPDDIDASDRPSAPERQVSYSRAYVWYVIGLLTVVNVFNYMDRMALSVMLPLIKADLALSDGQIGVLVGFAFAIFYAICGIPIARYADRGIRRNLIAIALGTWSIMTAISGAAQSFWHLFAARVGVGIGEAGGLSPALSILCDYVPLRRRAGVFAVHSFGLIAGMMLGMALAGWLAEVVGWRWAFVVLGLPGVAVAFVVRFTLREPVRGGLDAPTHSGTTPNARQVIAFLWQCRTFRLLMLFFLGHGFVYAAMTAWWPSFYARSFDLSLSSLGVYVGVGLGSGSMIGTLLGGALSNKGVQRDFRLPLVIGAAAMCLAIPTAIGSLFVSTALVSVSLVFVTGILWSVPNGAVNATVYSVVPPAMRATTGATTTFITSVVGFGVGPAFVGLLSDLLTHSMGTDALRYALLVPACLMPIAAFGLYAGGRSSTADLQRLEG